MIEIKRRKNILIKQVLFFNLALFVVDALHCRNERLFISFLY